VSAFNYKRLSNFTLWKAVNYHFCVYIKTNDVHSTWLCSIDVRRETNQDFGLVGENRRQ
jgi:hypothetical protein